MGESSAAPAAPAETPTISVVAHSYADACNLNSNPLEINPAASESFLRLQGVPERINQQVNAVDALIISAMDHNTNVVMNKLTAIIGAMTSHGTFTKTNTEALAKAHQELLGAQQAWEKLNAEIRLTQVTTESEFQKQKREVQAVIDGMRGRDWKEKTGI